MHVTFSIFTRDEYVYRISAVARPIAIGRHFEDISKLLSHVSSVNRWF